MRIALGNVRVPQSMDDAVDIAIEAMRVAANGNADLICFPECLVPGYRIESAPKGSSMIGC